MSNLTRAAAVLTRAIGAGVARDPARPRSSRANVLPWAVLGAGIVTSVLLFTFVRSAIEDLARLRFERQASDAIQIIEERILFYADILYALRALFASQEQVNRLAFQRFVAALELQSRYPGFDVVNYAVYVRGEDRARFVESVRRDTSLVPEGYPKFDIQPPGIRSEYFVLAYVEPMRGFEFAFGRDIGANVDSAAPQHVVAAQKAARDSGKLTASGVPIKINARGREYTGLAVRLAVYRAGAPADTVDDRRAAYLGSVGAGFSVDELMKGVLTAEATQYTRLRVYDVGTAGDFAGGNTRGKTWTLFDSATLPGAAGVSQDASTPSDNFSIELPLEFAGRQWRIDFSARKRVVIGRVDELLPWVIVSGGLLTSFLLAGILYSLASSRRRAMSIADEITKDLRVSEAELRASAEQLQAMSRRLVELQESERRQFSRELHDRVGQNLTALSITVDILKAELAASANPAVLVRLDDAAALLDSTHGTIENVMTELRPPMLDDYGLLPAIQWYAGEFGRRTGIVVNVRGDEQMQRLAQPTEIALFRIIQEALNNIAKHAHAKQIHVALERSAKVAVLSILDDGVGMQPPQGASATRRSGLGMVTMRERAQSVGGEFEIIAGPAGGTEVIVRVAC